MVHSNSVRLTLISKSFAPGMADVLPGTASAARSLRRCSSSRRARSAADTCRLLLPLPLLPPPKLKDCVELMHALHRMVRMRIRRCRVFITSTIYGFHRMQGARQRKTNRSLQNS